LLQRETPDFIGPDLWPPNSPDLQNPVDYKIWGVMQQRVYESRVNNVDELKQRLHDAWHAVVNLWGNAGERRSPSVFGGERRSPNLHDRCGWTRKTAFSRSMTATYNTSNRKKYALNA